MMSSTDPPPMLPRRDGGLLAPARAMLDRLRYPQKFALISLLFILPLAVVMYLLLSEIGDRIRFARQEIDGARYLRPLHAMQGHVGQSLFLTLAYRDGRAALRPDLIGKQAQIDEDLVALEAVDRELGAGLNTVQRVGALKENWRFLKEQTRNLSAGDAEALHDKLLAEIRHLMDAVGDGHALFGDLVIDAGLGALKNALKRLEQRVQLYRRERSTLLCVEPQIRAAGEHVAASDAAGGELFSCELELLVLEQSTDERDARVFFGLSDRVGSRVLLVGDAREELS